MSSLRILFWGIKRLYASSLQLTNFRLYYKEDIYAIWCLDKQSTSTIWFTRHNRKLFTQKAYTTILSFQTAPTDSQTLLYVTVITQDAVDAMCTWSLAFIVDIIDSTVRDVTSGLSRRSSPHRDSHQRLIMWWSPRLNIFILIKSTILWKGFDGIARICGALTVSSGGAQIFAGW